MISNKCDLCKINECKTNFYVQTPSYYRNKSSGHYYFCDLDCMNEFKKKYTCEYCGYDSGLKYNEEDDLMYCCDNPSNIMSCYEFRIGKYFCDWCLMNKDTNICKCFIVQHDDDNDDDYSYEFICESCFTPNKNNFNPDNKYPKNCCYEISSNKNFIRILNNDDIILNKKIIKIINKSNNGKCYECEINDANIVFNKCGHLSICDECYLHNDECPMCS